MNDDSLTWLQEFYASLCDGDWEHQWGIKITTIDNPGWSVKINLTDTILENLAFSEVNIEQDADHWVLCRVRKNFFEGVGGAHDLKTIIDIFRSWYDNAQENKNGANSA